jgi:threonine/homoserine/homoserine lactone efflux protein
MAFIADWLTGLVVAGLAMVSPGPNYAVTLKHGRSSFRTAR